MNEHNRITRQALKSLVLEQRTRVVSQSQGVRRQLLDKVVQKVKTGQVVVVTGIRRCGKSTLLRQYALTLGWDKVHYFSFEDERLAEFTAHDFNLLLEILIELYGDLRTALFDEIQNVPGWEMFVRRLHDDGYALVVTGSNARMLSHELGSKLTGRHVDVVLYPFSFAEYMALKHPRDPHLDPLVTAQRGKLLRYFNGYFNEGGMPGYLLSQDPDLLTGVYEDVLYRDIAQRFQIDNMKTFRELALYLLSHIGRPLSFNKLKQYFHLGSVNTVTKYVGYLENAYVLFVINHYSSSLKQQTINPKKIYGICPALLRAVGFSTSDQRGYLLENVAFLALKQWGLPVYYYLTRQRLELDFIVVDFKKRLIPMQVCTSLKDPSVRERELKALTQAMTELRLKQGWILTEAEYDDFVLGPHQIRVRPLFQWLSDGFKET